MARVQGRTTVARKVRNGRFMVPIYLSEAASGPEQTFAGGPLSGYHVSFSPIYSGPVHKGAR
jgi:hypothetical protein